MMRRAAVLFGDNWTHGNDEDQLRRLLGAPPLIEATQANEGAAANSSSLQQRNVCEGQPAPPEGREQGDNADDTLCSDWKAKEWQRARAPILDFLHAVIPTWLRRKAAWLEANMNELPRVEAHRVGRPYPGNNILGIV